MIIGQKTFAFTHKTSNIIQTVTPPPTQYRPVGGGGGCVDVESWLNLDTQAKDVIVGQMYRTAVPGSPITEMPVVKIENTFMREGIRLETESGASIRVAELTQFNLPSAETDLQPGHAVEARNMLGQMVLVERAGAVRWEKVVDVKRLGMIEVVPISFGGRSFAAGETPDALIYSHNLKFEGNL
jgi:hypothetical protein